MKTLAVALSLLASMSAFAGDRGSSGLIRCVPRQNPKLTSIIIPRIELQEATVAEAIEFLRLKSRQLDPEGVGVNIVLKLPPEGGQVVAPRAPGTKR